MDVIYHSDERLLPQVFPQRLFALQKKRNGKECIKFVFNVDESETW